MAQGELGVRPHILPESETPAASAAPDVDRLAAPCSNTDPLRRAPHALQRGARLGSYEVRRFIAYGGMSEVYEAEHLELSKRVAIKLLKPEMLQRPEARARFLDEGVAAARIHHTHVIDVIDVGMCEERPFLVMSLLEGESLTELFIRRGRLEIAELLDTLLPVAAGVAAGHARGIVHRDLKPDNILLHREGFRTVPKVLDFGISRLLEGSRQIEDTGVCGTPQYMSPEHARGELVDARSDVFAFGVLLYQGLTGCLPRDAADPEELLRELANDSFPAPSVHIPMDPELEGIVLRAMAHAPEARFPSMAALATMLLPFASPRARDYWREEFLEAPGEDDRDSELPAHPRRTPTPESRRSVAAGRAAREEVPAAVSIPPRKRTHGPGQPGWRAVTAVAVAGLVAGLSLAWLASRPDGGSSSAAIAAGSANEATSTFPVDVQVTPATASLRLDGHPVAVGRYRTDLLADGTLHTLVAVADGYETLSIRFADRPPPQQLRLSRVPAPESPSEDRAAAEPPRHRSRFRRAARDGSEARARRLTGRRDARRQRARADARPSSVEDTQKPPEDTPPIAADTDPEVAVIEPQAPRLLLIDDNQVSALPLE